MGLLTNKIFLSVVISGIVVQLIKVVPRLYKAKKLKFKDLFATGGMPSSHSAFVIALMLSVFLTEGFSTAFFVSFVLLAVVLRDSVGVRRAVGEEGRALEVLAKKTKIKVPFFHKAMGHTPLQVIVGLILGIVITLVVFYVF